MWSPDCCMTSKCTQSQASTFCGVKQILKAARSNCPKNWSLPKWSRNYVPVSLSWSRTLLRPVSGHVLWLDTPQSTWNNICQLYPVEQRKIICGSGSPQINPEINIQNRLSMTASCFLPKLESEEPMFSSWIDPMSQESHTITHNQNTVKPVLRDHLPWKTIPGRRTQNSQQILDLSSLKPPLLRDHAFVAEGVVFQSTNHTQSKYSKTCLARQPALKDYPWLKDPKFTANSGSKFTETTCLEGPCFCSRGGGLSNQVSTVLIANWISGLSLGVIL